MYQYNALFGNVFDCDKYAVTPSQVCRTSFTMFDDSGYKYHRDEIPVNVKSSGSSDKGDVPKPPSVTMDESGLHRGDKRKAAGK